MNDVTVWTLARVTEIWHVATWVISTPSPIAPICIMTADSAWWLAVALCCRRKVLGKSNFPGANVPTKPGLRSFTYPATQVKAQRKASVASGSPVAGLAEQTAVYISPSPAALLTFSLHQHLGFLLAGSRVRSVLVNVKVEKTPSSPSWRLQKRIG